MPLLLVDKNDGDVLNSCTKYLAREFLEARSNFGQYPTGDFRGFISDCWRFPIIDSYSDGTNFEASYAFNEVTFVYAQPRQALPSQVAVVGTFHTLYDPIPLRRVAATPYFTVSIVIPKNQVHTYKYMVDGQPVLDPINPQQVIKENGRAWSRFFTQLCATPISFDRRELALLQRIVDRILPFHTPEGQNFLQRYYDGLDRAGKETQYAHAYRLDEPAGAGNYIDKLLAKEENHHLVDYRVCLRQIDRVLRQRNPYTEPGQVSDELLNQLYDEMAVNTVSGWDYSVYANPAYFIKLLRRHTFTGAFSHPKYGGNSGAAGWAYLSERMRDPQTGQTLFDWPRITEKPLGASPDYHG